MNNARELLAKRASLIFPTILTLLLIVLTLFSVSGSSLGVYDSLLGEEQNTIQGEPRPVRSDEWLVNSPLTISQSNNDFPVINKDIGLGNDMAVTVDVPYKDWSTFFKPQNLAFFVLPLSMAFAFKWWLLSYLLLLAVYSFVLYFFQKKYVLASLLATAFVFSPFIQWWYQSVTLLPIAYSLYACILALIIFKKDPKLSLRLKILTSTLLIYILVSFVLILYPPFQIACALIALMIFAVFYWNDKPDVQKLIKDSLWLLAILVLTGLFVLTFVYNHQDAIKATLNTVYPGHRTVQAGGMPTNYFVSWPILYSLQDDVEVFGNQSESSNFLLVGILLLPFIWASLVFKNKAYIAPSKMYKLLLIASTASLAVILARLFIPFGDFAYKFTGLNMVPLNRLFIALGILNIIIIALAVELPRHRDRTYSSWRSMLYVPSFLMAVLAVISVSAALLLIKNTVTLPASFGKIELLAIVLLISAIIFLLSHQIKSLRYAGLLLLVCFGLYSSINVNPLYRGIGSIEDSKLVKQVDMIHDMDTSSAWIVIDKVPFEAIPTSVGARNFSGVYPYPQNELWKKYFPNSAFVYNRYAHVTFSVDDTLSARSITLLQGDTFRVSLPSCDPLLQELRINYMIGTSNPNGYSCYDKETTTYANGVAINIYSRK